MNKIEKAVLKVLKPHRGKNNPITTEAIAGKLKLPEREIRRAISGLVTDHRVLIGSSVRRPFGFYIIKNIEELRVCLDQYYSRLHNLKDRAKSLYRAGLKKFSKDIQNEFKFD